MKSPKHICIVAPSRKMGGIERALAVLANEFAKKGFKVSYISCLKGHAFYKLAEEITVIEFHRSRTEGIFNKLLFYPRLILFIRSTVLSCKPDAVLSFGDLFNPLVILALLGKKIPVFISDRTSPDYAFPTYIRKLKSWLYPRSAGFIAQSKVAADYKRQHFGNRLKIQIIPNAIREVNIYNSIPKENIILFAGRFAWEKDPLILIDAFSLLPNKSDFRLVLAGDGPQRSLVEQRISYYKLENQIELLGEQKDIDLQFSKAKIFVLSSVLEGFPNALAEAMSAGLAVICFDTIPYQELITNEYNGLVVRRSVKDLATAIQKVISNPELLVQLGEKAKEVRQRLDAQTIAQKYIDFIFQNHG